MGDFPVGRGAEAPRGASEYAHGQVGQCTTGIAQEGQPADALDIPEEADALHAHGGHAGSRTDDQRAAAGAGTEGEEFPEARSEERRVGKECRSRGAPSQETKKRRVRERSEAYQTM